MIEDESWSDDFSEKLCHHCGKDIVPGKEMGCVCAKYGYAGHEESAWCSDDCMHNDHPEP